MNFRLLDKILDKFYVILLVYDDIWNFILSKDLCSI